MAELAAILILALAAWRLAVMLVEEAGPWAVFARLRRRVGLLPLPVNHHGVAIGRVATTPLAELFACVWCMSLWTAAGLAVLLWLAPALRPVAVVLALSALAILMQEVVQWLRSHNG